MPTNPNASNNEIAPVASPIEGKDTLDLYLKTIGGNVGAIKQQIDALRSAIAELRSCLPESSAGARPDEVVGQATTAFLEGADVPAMARDSKTARDTTMPRP